LTNNTPTFKDSVVAGTTANGTFTSNITGLDFNRTYYVRAFAINSVDTAYGSAVSFTTIFDTNKVRFTYNGKEVVYGIIVSPTTGKKWLDRNLGAKQVATIHDGNSGYDDYLAYGDLFQWGRPADGHQLITWTSSTAGTAVNGTTTTLATSDNPGHSNFIMGNPWLDKGDWRSDNNSNRWNTTPQGPCPTGWHVPTKVEWAAEAAPGLGGTATTGGIAGYNTGYTMLKLTAAGVRAGQGDTQPAAGQVWNTGYQVWYWSSTNNVNGGGYNDGLAFVVAQRIAGFDGSTGKSNGCSVRCIHD
jgi:uncharacterized protein (TIGR02145 family)